MKRIFITAIALLIGLASCKKTYVAPVEEEKDTTSTPVVTEYEKDTTYTGDVEAW